MLSGPVFLLFAVAFVVVAALWSAREGLGCFRVSLERIIRGWLGIPSEVSIPRVLRRAFILCVEVVGLVVVLPTLITFLLELDDRRTERRLRAWEILLEIRSQVTAANEPVASGSAARDALRILNHDYAGRFCGEPIRRISEFLGGDVNRRCVIPAIERDALAGVQLPDVDLTGIELQQAILRRADLQGATIDTADLRGVDFTDASLNGARLNLVSLQGGTLNGVDFRGAQLNLAELSKTELLSTDSGRVILDQAALVFADLSKAKLSQASLTAANLYGANFAESELSGTDLTGSLLVLADLSGADLRGVEGLTPQMLDSTCIDPDKSIIRGGRSEGLRIEAAAKDYAACHTMTQNPKKQRRVLDVVTGLDVYGLALPSFAPFYPVTSSVDEWRRGEATDLSDRELIVLRDRLCANPTAFTRPGELFQQDEPLFCTWNVRELRDRWRQEPPSAANDEE